MFGVCQNASDGSMLAAEKIIIIMNSSGYNLQLRERNERKKKSRETQIEHM